MIIGLSGYAGSGKTTIANALLYGHGYERRKFATPLKKMLRALLEAQGADTKTVERMIEGDLKEKPSPLLNGRTPRHAMQTLGTEWGRGQICENLWSDVATRDLSPQSRVVFDDVRFENEAAAIRAFGGIVVRLARPGVAAVNGHTSENLPWADADIVNDRDASDVAKLITSLVLP